MTSSHRVLTPQEVKSLSRIQGWRTWFAIARSWFYVAATFAVAGYWSHPLVVACAMVFMARGGVYLAGGIPARIAPVLLNGGFRHAFEAKAPHDDILAEFATVIVATSDAALAGIEAFVRRPDSFVLDLDERTWAP